MKLAYNPCRLDGRLKFTDLSKYASSRRWLAVNTPHKLGRRAHYYAEFTVSSPEVAETIASTHYTCARRDDQAEWAWVA